MPTEKPTLEQTREHMRAYFAAMKDLGHDPENVKTVLAEFGADFVAEPHDELPPPLARAFRRGVAAYQRGASREEHGYLGQEKRNAWELGWDQAKHESEAATQGETQP